LEFFTEETGRKVDLGDEAGFPFIRDRLGRHGKMSAGSVLSGSEFMTLDEALLGFGGYP